jgi:glycine betaine/choline ABC-type transport system substrate-binding protein/actin-like ATPase involved in cell morphogenesis
MSHHGPGTDLALDAGRRGDPAEIGGIVLAVGFRAAVRNRLDPAEIGGIRGRFRGSSAVCDADSSVDVAGPALAPSGGDGWAGVCSGGSGRGGSGIEAGAGADSSGAQPLLERPLVLGAGWLLAGSGSPANTWAIPARVTASRTRRSLSADSSTDRTPSAAICRNRSRARARSASTEAPPGSAIPSRSHAGRAGGGAAPERGECGSIGGLYDRLAARRGRPGRGGSRAIGYQLGVDLGTTFMAAALVREGKAVAVTLGRHGVAVPSVVYLGSDGFVVGEPAVQRATSEPSRVAREFKRRVGDSASILVGGSPVAAELLMARSLAWIVGQVSQTEGEPPESLAVTHPANWGEYKLDLLGQAIRHVGLRVDHLVPEPVAAARFYAGQRRLEPGAVLAVYDLGGGTFDAAVVRVEDGGGFVLLGRPDGIEHLGGIDFDEAVVGHVLEVVGLERQAFEADDPVLRTALTVLRGDCVEAKEALSGDTEVAIPVMLPDRHTQVRLTRREFEDMIRPALDETVVALRRAVATAGVEIADLSAVLLVGGSSRIPLVGQLVGAELDRPIAVDARPKDVISMGAALFAADTPPPDPTPAVEEPAPEVPRDQRPPPPVAATAPAAAAAATPWASPNEVPFAAPPVPSGTSSGSNPMVGTPRPTGVAAGGGDRRQAQIAVGVIAVLAVLAAAFLVRGTYGGDDGDRIGGQASERPTEGYDPAQDGLVSRNFDLAGEELDLGWQTYSQSAFLGEVSKGLLEAAGAEVEIQQLPFSEDGLHGGLAAGDFDLAWEKLSELWTRSFDQPSDASPEDGDEGDLSDPAVLRDAVEAAEDEADNDVAWLDPAAFDPGITLMTNAENAESLALRTLSDLAGLDDRAGGREITLCSGGDPSTEVGLFEEVYGVDLPDHQSRETDADVQADVVDGTCTLGTTVPSSGKAHELGLVMLDDDRGALVAANPSLGVRSEVLDDLPELRDLFAPVASRLDDATITELMVRIEVDGEEAAAVARQWLAEQGFTEPAVEAVALGEEFDLAGTELVVASVQTDTQLLVGEITRLSLLEAGADLNDNAIEFEPDVGTGVHDLLVEGDIDLYWDRLGRARSVYLGHDDVARDVPRLHRQVADEDAANGVTWLPPASFNSGWVVATTQERADELGVRSLAQLADVPAPSDGDLLCSASAGSLTGWIAEKYGYTPTALETDDHDIADMIDSGDCLFGMVWASDPYIEGLDLVALDDPNGAVPEDGLSLAVRTEVAEAHPQVAEIIELIGAALTDDTIRTLNSRVVVDGESVTDVARSWLRDTGFVK